VILIAFPLRQWLHERAAMLRYMCIDCLFAEVLSVNLFSGSKRSKINTPEELRTAFLNTAHRATQFHARIIPVYLGLIAGIPKESER
jgi:hypothetical protein